MAIQGREKSMQRGFSLIEALVAMAILVVLAAAAFPAFTQMRLRHELRGVSDALRHTLSERKLEGMRTNRAIDVDFTAIVESEALNTQVIENTIGGSTAEEGSVRLEPRVGMLTDALDAGEMELRTGGYGVVFRVNSLGRSELCVPEGQLDPANLEPCE
jgi:prepilin-type N-terminal cleavage/methylation domain-containing protein